MQINTGIAYFGDEKIQGTLKDKVQSAIDSDVTSIQVKNTDIKSFQDFSGYAGEITCYLDDITWDSDYFNNLNIKLQKLQVLGLTSVVVPTMMQVSKYKSMNHDDKLNVLKTMSGYIVGIANMGIKVGLLNTCDGVFVGTVVLPIIYNLYPEISDKVGYAVNISETSDGGIRELDFRSVNTVNIEPIVEDGNLVYDRSRALIGNTYSEFVKFGHVPSIFAVASKMSLPIVNNLASLVSNIVNIVISRIGGVSSGRSSGMVKTKTAPGYHQTGVSDNAGVVEGYNHQSNFGFVDCMQLFLVLSTLCLIGVMIAIILVLL